MPKKKVMGTGNPVHFHVSTTSKRIFLAPSVEETKLNAEAKYDRMVLTIESVTGLKKKYSSSDKTTFGDGSKVEMTECDGNCLKKK
jgi:hypothetical protein